MTTDTAWRFRGAGIWTLKMRGTPFSSHITLDGWVDVDVFVRPEPHSDRNSQLDNFSDWYSSNYLPSIATEHWVSFQPISRSEVSVHGQDFYRLEYRLQASAEYCVENAVTDAERLSFIPRQAVRVCDHRLGLRIYIAGSRN